MLVMMVREKSNGLTFDVTSGGMSRFSKWGEVSAAALTQAKGNRARIGMHFLNLLHRFGGVVPRTVAPVPGISFPGILP
jgi:hypothetical protein